MREDEVYEELSRLTLGLGAAIRSRRGMAAHSQESLALRAGLSRVYLGDIERGERNPSLLHLLRIARALGVPVSRLVAEAEAKAGSEN